MERNQEMFLESASGFAMPFALSEGEEIQISLGFGEQTHPLKGEKFFHQGVDIVCKSRPLVAIATGIIVAVGTDDIHANYIIARYGKYNVKYGHIAGVSAGYGSTVSAGQPIARGGDFVHIEVRYGEEVLDPLEFLAMVESNIMLLESMGIKGRYSLVNMGTEVHTDYDKDQDEIVALMLRWLPEYITSLQSGGYRPSMRTEQGLRNVFAQAADKGYFFENIPGICNPLGLSGRSAALTGKVQNILIADFLNYLAVTHDLYLSSWNDEQKKNFLSRHQPMDM